MVFRFFEFLKIAVFHVLETPAGSVGLSLCCAESVRKIIHKSGVDSSGEATGADFHDFANLVPN